MSSQEDYEVEQTSHIVTKNSLGSFLLDGIDTKNLNADALSAIIDFDDYSDAGGVREAPTCQELAMEGETLTKQGDHREAIPLLESALELGSDDTQLHSVLWSLLGNAHFYLGDHEKAILCHSHDLAICCELQDEKSKAQAYCNLGIAHRKQGTNYANIILFAPLYHYYVFRVRKYILQLIHVLANSRQKIIIQSKPLQTDIIIIFFL